MSARHGPCIAPPRPKIPAAIARRASAPPGKPPADGPFKVLRLQIPPGASARRVPVVEVEGSLGPLRLTFTVASLAGNRLVVRPPVTGEGHAGITLPAELAPAVEAACVAAVWSDPLAKAALFRLEA